MDTGNIRATEDEALQFHASGRPGKLSIAPHKPLTTQRDLSLAYSPGVAFPCLRIQADPSTAFDYTSKGNFVAVISNGTAVLGLGVTVAASLAHAQEWPTRPVTIIGAGGPTDTLVRLVAQGMRGPLGQPVVIENVVGASGTIPRCRSTFRNRSAPSSAGSATRSHSLIVVSIERNAGRPATINCADS